MSKQLARVIREKVEAEAKVERLKVEVREAAESVYGRVARSSHDEALASDARDIVLAVIRAEKEVRKGG